MKVGENENKEIGIGRRNLNVKKMLFDYNEERIEYGIKGKVIKSYEQERKMHVETVFLNRHGKIIS